MNIGFELSQKLTQNLILTPEMIQMLNLLQMNILDLNKYVDEELMTNPLLERAEEMEKERVYDALSHRLPRNYKVDEGDDYDYEDFATTKYSLWEHLHLQFNLVKETDSDVCRAVDYIIDTLDKNGYRTERATLISQKLRIPYDKVKRAIALIQEMDPAGVSAKSLEECLILQLKRFGYYNEAFDCIINHHLDDLAANRIALIAKEIGADIDEAQEYCDMIRSLNPKPGASYGKGNDNRYIQPDCVLVENDGKFILLINEGDRPSLQISPYYSRLKNEAAGDGETLDYLNEKMNAAMSLMKGIEQRRNTIYKTTSAIVEYQMEFFQKGKAFLRPMTLADIAEIVEMHESTISRVVSGKYIQTPRGLFELKYFFGGGAATSEGSNVSSKLVHDYIRTLVEKEDAHHPLSDESIKDLLEKNYNIRIARRTIAKYRDLLGIPGASKRRRY